MKKLISICLSFFCVTLILGANIKHTYAENVITFEAFLNDLYADGIFDGKNTTVVQWSPDESKTVIQRIQSSNAQYGFDKFKDPNMDVMITNTSFRYIPADIPDHKDPWNPTVKTWFADEIINAEFQFENAGDVTIENCEFNQVLVSPYGNGTNDDLRRFVVKNCTFNNVYDAYALKDIYPYSVEITNNNFNNCSGAIYFEGNVERGDITITNNTFNSIDIYAAEGKQNTRGIIQLSAAFMVGGNTNFVIQGNMITGNLVKKSNEDTTNHLPVIRLISTTPGLSLNGWTAGEPLSVLVNTAGAPLPSLSTVPQEVNGVTYTFLGWIDEVSYLGATATYPEETVFMDGGNTSTTADQFYYAVWKTEEKPEATAEPTATPTSTPEPSNDDHRSCDIKGDLNCDGVVTCDEAMGPGWVWSEEANACVLPTPVATEQPNVVGFRLVNTFDR